MSEKEKEIFFKRKELNKERERMEYNKFKKECKEKEKDE